MLSPFHSLLFLYPRMLREPALVVELCKTCQRTICFNLCSTNAFLKVTVISSQRKRSKIFSTTLAFSLCFPLSTLFRFRMTTNTFWCVFKSLRHRFQKPPFSPIRRRTGTFSKQCSGKTRVCFQNRIRKLPFLSAFSVLLVWTIGKNASKRMRFRSKMHLCGLGLRCRFRSSFYIVWSFIEPICFTSDV